MTHENLKGRVAVVTGGGGVLCSGFAKDLASQGMKTAILDLNKDAAQAVADEITAAGGTAIAVACNVLDADSLSDARKEINEKHIIYRFFGIKYSVKNPKLSYTVGADAFAASLVSKLPQGLVNSLIRFGLKHRIK